MVFAEAHIPNNYIDKQDVMSFETGENMNLKYHMFEKLSHSDTLAIRGLVENLSESNNITVHDRTCRSSD